MKNLKKISRDQMKTVQGGWGGIIGGTCKKVCCPPPGVIKCANTICPAVVCPQYD